MVRKDIVQGTHEFRGETFDVKEIVKTKSKYIDTYHEATFKPIHVLARLHNYIYNRDWRNDGELCSLLIQHGFGVVENQEGNLGVLIADQDEGCYRVKKRNQNQCYYKEGCKC